MSKGQRERGLLGFLEVSTKRVYEQTEEVASRRGYLTKRPKGFVEFSPFIIFDFFFIIGKYFGVGISVGFYKGRV